MKHAKEFFITCIALLFIRPSYAYDNFLVLSDIHLDNASTHHMEINPAKRNNQNDLDTDTFNQLLLQIKQNIDNGTVLAPKLIIILGDIAGHTRTSENNAPEDESIVFGSLKQTFPNTPIFYTFGNNDSLEKNYGSFSTSTPNLGQYKSPYEVAKNNGWLDGFLSTGAFCAENKNNYPCLINENKNAGYYTAYLEPHFRLIALNTVLFSINRSENAKADAAKELIWLADELQSANKHNESVLLTMHIPPGKSEFDESNFWQSPSEQNVFLNLLKKYQENMVGTLASHTHMDEFTRIKDGEGRILSGIYFVPGLSTSHGNAPSFKTFYYTMKDNHWQLSDFDAFYFFEFNQHIGLNYLYNFNEYYCQSSHAPLSDCLSSITPLNMQTYYAAGNVNFTEAHYPTHIDLVI